MIALIEINHSANQSINISTFSPQEIVVTNITHNQTICIEQDSSQGIDIDTMPSQEIEVKQDGININVYDVPFYEGEYKVTPRFTEQALATAQRILKNDMIIDKIPYYEVTNNSGGVTAVIG